MARFLKTAAAAAGLFAAATMTSAAKAEASDAPGRYQAISLGGDRVLVIDTATGNCWSKRPGEAAWRSEGSPAADAGPGEGRLEPTLSLPETPPDITIRQRGRAEVPGSAGTVFVHVDDVTGGQALVAVRGRDGESVAAERSLAPGQSLPFEVGGEPFAATVLDLRSFLTGEDFAVVRIERAAESVTPVGDAAAGSEAVEDAPAASDPVPPAVDRAAETRKIEALIAHVEAMTDATFVRYDGAYDSKTAAALLRLKWEWTRSRVRTAKDFVEIVASGPSRSGEPYVIRLADGTEVRAGDYLHKVLERIENSPEEK